MKLAAAIIALLWQASDALAREPPPGPRVGDVYEIRSERVSTRQSADGSGSSHDRDSIVERVIAVRDGGVELEFDLAPDATAQDRAASWQFPVRVFRPSQGPLELLNGAELESRVDRWLRAAGWTREICGHWIFTWNAFRIDCDPQSAVAIVAGFDLEADDLRDGAAYREAGALGEGMLRREPRGSGGAAFTVRLEVDPEAVRRERAEADAVTIELLGDSPQLRAAMQARSAERISGTVDLAFETDEAGRVRRRTKITTLRIEEAGGRRETETITHTLERRLVSRSAR